MVGRGFSFLRGFHCFYSMGASLFPQFALLWILDEGSSNDVSFLFLQ